MGMQTRKWAMGKRDLAGDAGWWCWPDHGGGLAPLELVCIYSARHRLKQRLSSAGMDVKLSAARCCANRKGGSHKCLAIASSIDYYLALFALRLSAL